MVKFMLYVCVFAYTASGGDSPVLLLMIRKVINNPFITLNITSSSLNLSIMYARMYVRRVVLETICS